MHLVLRLSLIWSLWKSDCQKVILKKEKQLKYSISNDTSTGLKIQMKKMEKKSPP